MHVDDKADRIREKSDQLRPIDASIFSFRKC